MALDTSSGTKLILPDQRDRGRTGSVRGWLGLLLLAAATLLPLSSARAELLRVAAGQKGFWDTTITTWGERAGLFRQEGLELEILYTDGGAETQQAVISGGVDIGIGAGILGVASAAAKGAPIRILCAQWTGAGDLFWYARADGPIRTLADAAGGRTMGFSTPGSSSNLVALALLEQAGVRSARPTATGGAGATLTQVMSGQIDIGWSVPPIALREVDRGILRIVARGTDAPALAGQTTRVNIANADLLKNRRDSATRFMRAYVRTLDWAYSDPQAIAWFAEGLSVDPALARRVRDEFYPRSAMQPAEVRGMDMTLRQAVELRRIPASTTPAQAATWLDVIVPEAK